MQMLMSEEYSFLVGQILSRYEVYQSNTILLKNVIYALV